METLYIGGVPEHFNLPWYLTLSKKEYAKLGVNLRWKDFPGGTGAMCEALRNREIDMAVILTEGIIRDIVHGNPSLILQQFIGSPLQWGIHAAAQSSFDDLSSIKGTRAAISRFGSGSHLMAYVNAMNEGWDLEKDLNFSLINNLDGALKALPNQEAEYFMWEKYTTQPFVDSGIFKRIGVCPTPWPCFVIAVRREVWENKRATIMGVTDIINRCTGSFKEIPEIDQIIASRYGQKQQDVRKWLSETEWSDKPLSLSTIDQVQDVLQKAGLIDNQIERNLFLAK